MFKSKKIDKVQKILKDEDMSIVILEDDAFINGDAFEIICAIQKLLREIIEDGFPKDLAKEIIEIAFMSEEEKQIKIEEELERLQKNINKLLKKADKETKNESK